MDQEFITIREAAQLLQRADSAVMRLIKEALSTGVEKESIMKTEMREGRMMYLVNKAFLVEEAAKEKAAPKGGEPPAEGEARPGGRRPEDSGRERPQKERTFEQPHEKTGSPQDIIDILQKIIDKKDEQIADLSGKIDQLIERDRETNILLKGLQDRLFLLEQGDVQEQAGKENKREMTTKEP